MTRRLFATFLMVVVAAVATSGCDRKRPSIVLVSIDSLRADEVEAVVDGRPVAPRLRDLAGRSLVFERAYAAAPWTTPSMTAVMTGLPAPVHGVEEHDRALAGTVTTLAEGLRAAGYRTAGFASAATLRPEFGFGRGFDVYDYHDYGHLEPSSPALTGKVQNRLQQWGGEDDPFFLWVHLWDPHYNYVPPPPYDAAFAGGKRPESDDVRCLKWGYEPVTPDEARWLRGRFRGEVSWTDRHLGEILDAVRATRRDVIVAVVGDHGEAFLERGWLGHTFRVDEEMIRVPLLIHAPGMIAPARVAEPVSIARLGPTLLALAGRPHEGPGVEPPLAAPPALPPAPDGANARPVVVETLRQGCYTAVIAGRSKYVVEHRTCAEELFDLVADPGETRNLAPGGGAGLETARRTLAAELERFAAAKVPRASLPPEIADEAEKTLRSLGYLGGTKGGSAMETDCRFAPRVTAVDTFGDVAPERCPASGVRRCLALFASRP